MTKTPLLIAFIIASPVAAAGDPAIPGHHPLSTSEAGSVLISELRCAVCHEGIGRSSLPEKTAPDLSQVGTRVTPDFLRRFVESPSAAHPGTTMPDMLVLKPASERQAIAEALTHFLISQSKTVPQSVLTESIDRKQGKDLFHSVGCVACHGPKEPHPDVQNNAGTNVNPDEDADEDADPALAARKTIKPVAIPLGHVGTKYTVRSLSEFLFQPLHVRSSGRMPDMKLTPAESLAIAGYLIGDQTPSVNPLALNAELVEQGKKHFQTLNCASCHKLPGVTAASLIALLKTADLNRGCLSKSPSVDSGNRSPRFDLDEAQITAMTAAIRDASSTESDQLTLAKTLTTFRCTSCHVRDDYGGVHDDHNPFFAGSELKLGDDGRIPPPLTLVGAKLQPAWMKRVLFDGESIRHYMSTRMPQYGTANLHHLPDLFGRLDHLDGPEMKIPNPETRDDSEREKEKLMRAAGRELLGDKGANCIACHTFNGKAARLKQGIDLLTSYQRLQPAWFNAYLRNPGAFRARTVMPTAWPNGRAVFTTILDGDTDRQIESIWYYLSLGTSAADPPGVRGISTKLEVTDHASLHRGRSRVAGFRGIAVGLPEKISYAFNAETGTLSAIWLGDFIHVNWSGQGSGDFNPASDPVTLAQDVSFAQLADAKAAWPAMPMMTKEAKTNPNPLYPKNVGYQFRGYFLDDQFVPSFLYRSGNVEIQDRSDAVKTNDTVQLRRTIQLNSPEKQSLWFRVLTGKIERDSESKHIFRTDRLSLTVPDAEAMLRTNPETPDQSELLLHLQLPQGKTTLEFLYEPIKK